MAVEEKLWSSLLVCLKQRKTMWKITTVIIIVLLQLIRYNHLPQIIIIIILTVSLLSLCLYVTVVLFLVSLAKSFPWYSFVELASWSADMLWTVRFDSFKIYVIIVTNSVINVQMWFFNDDLCKCKSNN